MRITAQLIDARTGGPVKYRQGRHRGPENSNCVVWSFVRCHLVSILREQGGAADETNQLVFPGWLPRPRSGPQTECGPDISLGYVPGGQRGEGTAHGS
ncbi:MAG TPA: hypothetical protein VF148_14700, partial [Acidimicrobiia bacterium]